MGVDCNLCGRVYTTWEALRFHHRMTHARKSLTDPSVRFVASSHNRCAATQAPGYECDREPQHEGIHCWRQVSR